MKHLGALIAGALAMLALGVGTAAAGNFTSEGAAQEIALAPHNFVFDLVSNTWNANPNDDYSDLTRSASTGLTLAGITNLSTDYYVQAGNCGGGAPRFLDRHTTGKSTATCSPTSATRRATAARVGPAVDSTGDLVGNDG